MEFNRENLGTAGWLGLAAYILAWDIAAPETLTHAYKRYHTAIRVGALAVTGAHLMGVIPKKVDPFYVVAELPLIRRAGIDMGPTVLDDTMEL